MAEKSSDKQPKSSFNGIVLKKRKSQQGKTYYSVLYHGKNVSVGNKRLVGFPSRATEGNITITAMEDKGGATFQDLKSIFSQE